MHEQDSVLERQHAGSDECRVLTEAVPCRDLGRDALSAQKLGGDDRHREDGRLRMLGQLQLIGRALEAELADGVAQRLIRLGKSLLCEIIGIEEILPHTDNLRPLPGE